MAAWILTDDPWLKIFEFVPRGGEVFRALMDKSSGIPVGG